MFHHELRLGRLGVVLLVGAMLSACAPAAPQASTSTPKSAPAVAPTEAAAKAVPTDAPAQTSTGPAPAPKAAAVVPKAAAADAAVADFYRGKNVRIVVGSSAGGGFDTYARLIAKYMPQYVPGNPAIIVENRPGAGSLVAANTVYNTDPKDGTVIVTFVEGIVLQQALGAEGIEFDARKYNWLGSSVKTFTACMVRSDSPVKSIQEVIDGKELVVGTQAPGTTTHDMPNLLNATLGTNIKLVSGYQGTSKIRLGLESREVDGMCQTFESMVAQAGHLLEGDNPAFRVLVVTADETPDHPFLKGVPAARTLAKDEEARQLLALADAPARMGKPYAVAPGVPAERVEALRSALAATYANPQFLEDSKRAGLDVTPSTGAEVESAVNKLLNTPPAVAAKLKEILSN